MPRVKALTAVEGIGTLGWVIDAYFTIGNGARLRTGKVQHSIFVHSSNPCWRGPQSTCAAEIQLAIDAYPAKVTAARAAGYIGPGNKMGEQA